MNYRFGIALVAALHLSCAVGVALAVGPAPASSPRGDALARKDSQETPEPLRVVVFYSPTCAGCQKLKKVLAASEKRWGRRIHVERRESFAELYTYEKHYGTTKETGTQKGFVGGRCVTGVKAIARRLDDVIAEELAKGSVTFVPPRPQKAAKNAEEVRSGIIERFRSFSVAAVVVAGLVDGINPCAFTTIIFLLSMLAYLGKSRRQLAVVGIGFTSAVFVTYLLLGFAFFRAIKVFSVSHGISTAMAYVVAGLAFVLAGWSLVDFVRYTRTGDVKKVTLGLPKSVKARIRKVIRVGLSTRGLLAGSVGVGVLVALLESLCTGQVYLPTIVLVAREPGLRAGALGYLVLYNLMFIAPLVGILVIAYFGVKSDRLGAFLVRRLAAFKLAMALLFAGLGVLVLATV